MLAPRKTIMADIPEDIKALDMAQLRSKLREMGVNIGPIAPSAKTIFQRRLVKAIAAKSGVANTCTDIVDSSNTATDSSKEVTSKLDSSADAFFALSLPENIDPQLALEGIAYLACIVELTGTVGSTLEFGTRGPHLMLVKGVICCGLEQVT